jgi:hypothetical protein
VILSTNANGFRMRRIFYDVGRVAVNGGVPGAYLYWRCAAWVAEGSIGFLLLESDVELDRYAGDESPLEIWGDLNTIRKVGASEADLLRAVIAAADAVKARAESYATTEAARAQVERSV